MIGDPIGTMTVANSVGFIKHMKISRIVGFFARFFRRKVRLNDSVAKVVELPTLGTRGGSESWYFKQGTFDKLRRSSMPAEMRFAALFAVGDRSKGISYSVSEYIGSDSPPPHPIRFSVLVTMLLPESPNVATIMVPTFVDLLSLLSLLEPLTRGGPPLI